MSTGGLNQRDVSPCSMIVPGGPRPPADAATRCKTRRPSALKTPRCRTPVKISNLILLKIEREKIEKILLMIFSENYVAKQHILDLLEFVLLVRLTDVEPYRN